MERRAILKGIFYGTAMAGVSPLALSASHVVTLSNKPEPKVEVRDYLSKIKNFDHHFAEDVVATPEEYKLLKSVVARQKRLIQTIGYAHFALMSFDDALMYAKSYSRIGEFTKPELEFMEKIFYRNAKDYGFYGDKVMAQLTGIINERDTQKIPHTGNYLFKGDSTALYTKIHKDLRGKIYLTSGVRGIPKQIYLFLNKTINTQGNYSMASRSLAPPGHSYHGVGDFDVGKIGFGYRNFTEDFAHTDEYKRLEDLGYARIRYSQDNPFGVRYEPWHIKVTA